MSKPNLGGANLVMVVNLKDDFSKYLNHSCRLVDESSNANLFGTPKKTMTSKLQNATVIHGNAHTLTFLVLLFPLSTSL